MSRKLALIAYSTPHVLSEKAEKTVESVVSEDGVSYDTVETIRKLEEEMRQAVEVLEFEPAAMLLGQIIELKTFVDEEL